MFLLLIFLITVEPPLDWHQNAALSAMEWETCSLARISDHRDNQQPIGDVADAAMATCVSAGERFEEFATKYYVEDKGFAAETGRKMAQNERANLNAPIHEKVAAVIATVRINWAKKITQ